MLYISGQFSQSKDLTTVIILFCIFVNGMVKRLKIGVIRFAGNTIQCRVIKSTFKVKSCKKIAQYCVLKQQVKISGDKC